jgi:hypothetical protein
MRYLNNQIRQAIVTDVNHEEGKAQIKFLDKTSDEAPEIPVPHPYAGSSGEGIFVGTKPGTNVSVGMMSYERYIPIGTVPIKGVYGDLLGTNEIDVEDIGYPKLSESDIVIQGRHGAQFRLDGAGDILIKNEFDEGLIMGGNRGLTTRCSIDTKPPVHYEISQSGLLARGIVRRDSKIEDDDESFVDFLYSLSSESLLEPIGRHPEKKVAHLSQKNGFRNPAFVEDRKVIFEFGRDWNVGTYDVELSSLNEDQVPIYYSEERRERRNNLLSLSLTAPNELIESVTGTLVDIFGNLLDINKNIIEPPAGEKTNELLDDMYEKIRHTVAYHLEINSRKGYAYRNNTNNISIPTVLKNSPDPFTTENNSRDRSRWAARIDKEGLTTLNIPATSETGNVPLLTRQETTSVVDTDENGNPLDVARNEENGETKDLYRNKKSKDIFLDQFGPGGISLNGRDIDNRLKNKETSWIEDSRAKLPEKIQSGTAFHNITKTAEKIIKENINKKASDVFNDVSVEEAALAVTDEINVFLPNKEVQERDPKTGIIPNQPNAGGRSAQINLDGSLEASIGANTIDRVSLTMDTAGAVVAHMGRDRRGRSAILQSDGDVLMEVGGWDFIGESADDTTDTRFVGLGVNREESLPLDPKRFKDGKLVIRIRRSNGEGTGPDGDNQDHILTIDETGITIESAGRMNFKSTMDMTFKSDSGIILDSRYVMCYPENPRFFTKSGRRIA